MRVLVVGGGGREHALAWKISKSPLVSELWAAPGNPGIARHARCADIAASDVVRLANFARERAIDLTVVGPEGPLVSGLADHFATFGLPVFGPRAGAAQIEGSKIYAKELMRRHNVPTARSKTFEGYEGALFYLEDQRLPLVVKADGLASGKGAFVCHTAEEARYAVRTLMCDRAFGEAGDRVLIEEFLAGEEVSLLALTDGRTIAPLEAAQDSKRALDGDQGPNTGGMGAYSPAPAMTPAFQDKIERTILLPTVHALNIDDRPYRGVLYAGLILTDNGPQVLEYNCRFGDPETQPLLMRLKSDLVPLLLATVQGRLEHEELEWDPRPAVCVVMASGGYPGSHETGYEITGLDEIETSDDLQVFHAGTAMKGNRLVTAGGRVLGVTALGETFQAARERAYAAVERIRFEKRHFRTDIGARAIR